MMKGWIAERVVVKENRDVDGRKESLQVLRVGGWTWRMHGRKRELL